MTRLYPPDLPDDELDAAAREAGSHTGWGVGAFLDELNRRAVDRQTKQSIALTEEIRRLTAQLRWLTVAAVALAAVAIVVAVIAIGLAERV